MLELQVEEGEVVGVGEAAPLEPYDGVSLDAVRAALERYRPLLEDAAHGDGEDLVDACWLEADLPQAVAAIDLALWDLEGKQTARPVAELLGAPAGAPVPVNATIGAVDRAGAAAEAAAAVAAGFTTREGQGRRGRRRGPPAAAARAVAPRPRCGPTPTGRGRWTRRSRRWHRWRASGSSWSRSRCTAWRRCGRCGSAWRCRS